MEPERPLVDCEKYQEIPPGRNSQQPDFSPSTDPAVLAELPDDTWCPLWQDLMGLMGQPNSQAQIDASQSHNTIWYDLPILLPTAAQDNPTISSWGTPQTYQQQEGYGGNQEQRSYGYQPVYYLVALRVDWTDIQQLPPQQNNGNVYTYGEYNDSSGIHAKNVLVQF